MRWFQHARANPVAAIVALALGAAGAPHARAQTAASLPPRPALSPLMLAVDRAALRSGDPAGTRPRLIAGLRYSHNCYPSDLTPEQLDALIARTDLLPPTLMQRGPFGPRFFADTTCWLGPAGLGETGTSRPAQLTYSFPDDGPQWGLTCAGFIQGPNDLGARLITAYGSLDRGRELIRSAIAGWRSVAGLSYLEVEDNNSAEDVATTHTTVRGDIRIGGLPFAPIGNPLAYNAFPSAASSPCSGGDMTINTNYFTSAYFTNPNGNFLYFRNTVSHEHGHGLGYLHVVPCSQTKLMEPQIHTGVFTLGPDDVRAAIRNYGDRFSPLNNHSAPTAVDFGNLTTPTLRSILERDLGLNGPVAVVSGNPPVFLPEEDWFRFTIDSTQPVTISADPTGYGPSGACCIASTCTTTTQVKCAAVGGSFVLRGTCLPSPCTAASLPTSCSGGNSDPPWCQGPQSGGCSGTIASTDATQAGNLTLELRASNGVTILASSSNPTLGLTEAIAQPTLTAGTYYVRVFDTGGAGTANQVVQTYDLTVRVGTSKAPPHAVAGLNRKRVAADTVCTFMGNHNSYATEAAATLPTANFAWDLDGDGVYDSAGAGQPQPSFTYRSNGTFNVTLKVTDSNGLSATDAIQCVVFGATTTITSVSPASAAPGATVPITIIGSNFKGVTSASQVSVAGGGVTVTGTPVVNLLGTRITGLSLVLAPTAAPTSRTITITNSDGLGATGGGVDVFSVESTTPTGACCSGSTCSLTSAAACAGPNHAFAGLSTACNAPGNLAAPCCLANFNQNGALEVQDIFDYLNAWFALDPAADINGAGVSVQDIFDFLNAWFTGC